MRVSAVPGDPESPDVCVRHHRVVTSEPVDDVAVFLARFDEGTRRLVEGRVPAYEAARQLLALAFDSVRHEGLRPVAWPLWLIWGSLTDWADGPRGNEPGAEAAAAAAMRRAAAEWLAVDGTVAAREGYFDRWIYDECGYARPADNR